jgi:hypothetical protein
MRGILYNPDDFHTINTAGNFFTHILGCADCRAKAQEPPQLQAVSDLWDMLDKISLDPLDRDDIEAGLRMCDTWMTAHMVVAMIDAPDEDDELQPRNDEMLEVVRGESPTKH